MSRPCSSPSARGRFAASISAVLRTAGFVLLYRRRPRRHTMRTMLQVVIRSLAVLCTAGFQPAPIRVYIGICRDRAIWLAVKSRQRCFAAIPIWTGFSKFAARMVAVQRARAAGILAEFVTGDRILAGFLVVVIASVFPTAAFAESTVIKAGHLIDTDSGQVLTNQQILVQDGKISAVGEKVDAPKDAKFIDLSGKTVLPGLFDCHTHLTDSTEDADPFTQLKKTAAQKAFESIPNARKTLEAGFTTVRDVGTFRALVDVALRDAIARGDVVGPRVFACGAYITITGGGGALSGFAPDISLPPDMHFGQADGPWQVRQRIRELAHCGVDCIKMIATGAILTHGSNPNAEEFTPEEMNAAVNEAKKFGLKVAAHAHSAVGIKDAVRAGVASIEHGTFLDDEGIALMKEHGTYLDADIYNDEYIQGEGKAKGMPKDFLEHDAELGRIQRENFEKAVKAGVKMAFGTDAAVFPHGQNARQFAWMVKYGMTPMQAIQAATINSADLVGVRDRLGSIKPGKTADIIAVDGDPLSDIRTLEHVRFVMKGGHVYPLPE